ncbi:MAG: cytochrome b/b6 domain-containing protein [Chloroflexi bacterium]|nr:cytochrome b/b6 domain-containing protein [Chloroflexota bacterium]
MKDEDRQRPIRRFDLHERLQHITLLVAMILLGMTGLPRAFPEWPTAQWWIALFGGVEKAGVAHHYIGYLLDFTIFYHALYLVFRWVVVDKKPPLAMLPTLKDAKDFLHSVLYIMGLLKSEPRYGRFGYGAKIDYWVVVAGAPLMALSGILVYHAEVVGRFFPPLFIAILVALHISLALFLAVFIIVVHIYYAVLAPEVFPLNTSIFTGVLSPAKYKQLFPLEYLRIMKKRGALDPEEEEEIKDTPWSEYFKLPLLRWLPFGSSGAAQSGGVRPARKR